MFESLIFPLSGGVIAETKTINLPNSFLRIVDAFDNILIKCFPNIFALGRKVDIKKVAY